MSAELQKEAPDWASVDKLYTDLVGKTTPVNGRSLPDSLGRSLKRLLGIASVTGAFFLVAAQLVAEVILMESLALLECPVMSKMVLWCVPSPVA